MKEKLKTPFGKLIVLLNGKKFDYNCVKTKKMNKGIDIFLVEIDLSNCKINDTIECFIDGCDLEYYDSDERNDLLIKEDNNIALGVCGYEPQYHEFERLNYCYELQDYMDGQFVYKVFRNPKNYDKENNKNSCVIKLEICWLNTRDFEDVEETLFDILC
ncbi:MAG: hypothetical protein IJX34_01030 [Clostridia bacterium]|nr:hypothetical protein [Clostridia bacterium]